MGAWQPIETAPQDTTEVIVRCGPKDIRLGWYFAPSSQTFGWLDQWQNKIKPTHWMPLPTPPSIALVDEAQSKAAGK